MAAEAATPENITFFVRHTSEWCTRSRATGWTNSTSTADGARERRSPPHCLHLQRGPDRRDDHRDLCIRPRSHPERTHRPHDQGQRPGAPRSRPTTNTPEGDRARQAARRSSCRPRQELYPAGVLCEIVTMTTRIATCSRPRGVLRAARPADDQHRPTDQVPTPEREADQERIAETRMPTPWGDSHLLRLRVTARRRAARRIPQGCRAGRGGRAGGPLRMPDR